MLLTISLSYFRNRNTYTQKENITTIDARSNKAIHLKKIDIKSLEYKHMLQKTQCGDNNSYATHTSSQKRIKRKKKKKVQVRVVCRLSNH